MERKERRKIGKRKIRDKTNRQPLVNVGLLYVPESRDEITDSSLLPTLIGFVRHASDPDLSVFVPLQLHQAATYLPTGTFGFVR